MNANRQSANRYFSFLGRALVTVVFSAACLTLPIAPAFADGSSVSIPEVKVQYVRSMFANEGYADDLYARLKDAAEQVCGEVQARFESVPEMTAFGGRPNHDVDRCVGRSLARAVADVGAPELQDVHKNSRKGIVRIASSR